jgi:hypothetical protein
MGAVDTTAARARDMLLRDEIPEGAERHAWARFIMSLMLRGPEEIKVFKERFIRDWYKPNPDLQSRYDAAKEPDWPPTLEEYFAQVDPTVAERTAIIILTNLVEHENVTRTLMAAPWWVLDTGHLTRRLMTSDHPVVMTNGLGRADAHFALPISPTKLFVGFVTELARGGIMRMPVGKVVRLVNDAVIGQGRKWVYGVDHSQLSEVRRRFGKRDYLSFVPQADRL